MNEIVLYIGYTVLQFAIWGLFMGIGRPKVRR